jgi:hypothetical protein
VKQKHGSKQRSLHLPLIGWREWVALPDFGISEIKAKVDSGARSSSLHAYNIKVFERRNEQWVRFGVHPVQKNSKIAVQVESPIVEFRSVRNSSGLARIRPVILTHVELMNMCWLVELTLAGRDNMGFRMLLGREAFRGRFLVDGGRSFYGGRPGRKTQASKDNQ